MELYPNEQLTIRRGIPCLTWSLNGQKERPLALFLTGGGHLGRIAYGHPACDPHDFLAHWLNKAGYNLLVASPPIEHPLFATAVPELDITSWTQVLIDLAKEKIEEWGLEPSLVAIAWSMSGRFATRLRVAASANGLELEAFVALAATPPIPGLSPINLKQTPLGKGGFRRFTRGSAESGGGAPISQNWLRSLSEQDALEGRVIIPPKVYLLEFVGNSPINLHGEALRWRKGRLEHSYQEAVNDVLAMEYREAPLCASIVPTAASDRHHALTDNANWTFFNANVVSARATSRPSSTLNELQQLVASLPRRLCRNAVGGHFFFVGAKGASETAKAIRDLHSELLAVETELHPKSPRLTGDLKHQK